MSQSSYIFKGWDEQPEVAVHVGTIDKGRKGDEILQNEYRGSDKGLKSRTSQGSNSQITFGAMF